MLIRQVSTVQTGVDYLKDRSHERFYRDKASSVFGLYLRKGKVIDGEIGDALHEALLNQQISRTELKQVLATDLLWGGQTRQDKRQVVLVLEASWLAETTDVQRAAERAAILRRIGVLALPVVAGREWLPEATTLAQSEKVIRTTNGQIDDDSWDAAMSLL